MLKNSNSGKLIKTPVAPDLRFFPASNGQLKKPNRLWPSPATVLNNPKTGLNARLPSVKKIKKASSGL